MKKSKLLRPFAAVLMAGTMIVAMGMSAFAEEAGGATTPSGNSPVTFTKTLDMTSAPGASVPDITFTYDIAVGVGAAATDTTPEILAGVGSPVIGNAEFQHTDTANNSVTKTVTVNFDNVTFTKPGIYRYVITEKDTSNNDITNDANATRYLDVYVVNGDTEGTFKISSYVVFAVKEGDAVPVPGTDGAYPECAVKKGYTNMYATYKLTLDKIVTGAMGDKSKEFDFTITFSGPANASFTYGNEKITLNNNGTATVTGIKLADGTPVKEITGIPSTVKYTITENIDSKEGYTTSNTVNNVDTEGGKTTGEKTMGKTDNAVVFTNNKDAVTPTGIITNIVPYVMMLASAVVLAFVFLRKRNYEK